VSVRVGVGKVETEAPGSRWPSAPLRHRKRRNGPPRKYGPRFPEFSGLSTNSKTSTRKPSKTESDVRITSLEVSIGQVLTDAFGSGPERQLYVGAANLDTAWIAINRPTPLHVVHQGLIKGKERAITLLKLAVQSFENKIADLDDTAVAREPAVVPTEFSQDVFIVHGRDDPAKTEVARLIERAGLNAVILHEQPNAGRTIIEKFEKYGGSAGFAVVLLTPDDVGGPGRENLRPRARQNVIGEMFWFAGKLGRDRVCALKKGDIEMPSDLVGVGYTEMDDRGAWKTELLKELNAAGYGVDWQKALA
jgi:predicted nucleotide-binding protein